MTTSRQGFISRPWLRIVLLVLGVLFTAIVVGITGFRSDDAYISYRYALNLLHGRGLVYNPGEYVDGYTNFLWVLWNGVGLWNGYDPYWWSVVWSLVAWCALVHATMTLANTLGVSPNWQWVAALAIALSVPSAVWACSGLETCVVAWCCVTALIETVKQRWRRAAIWYVVAFLLRPDAALWWGLITLLHRGTWVPTNKTRVWWWLVFVGVVGVFWGWRTLYYGSLFPNSLLAKTGGGLHQQLAGLGYVLRAFAWRGVVPLLVMVWFGPWRDRRYQLVAGIVIVHLMYLISVGGDWMPALRMLVVVEPLLAILLVMSLAEWHRYTQPYESLFGSEMRFFAKLVTGLVLLLYLGVPWVGLSALYPDLVRAGQQVRRLLDAGQHLAEHALPDAIIAVNPAGALPYRAHRLTIDMTGLCDRNIARQPGGLHQKSDSDYVLNRAPDIIVLIGKWNPTQQQFHSTLHGVPGWHGEDELFAHPKFQHSYNLQTPEVLPYYHEWSILLFHRRPVSLITSKT